MSTLLVSSRFLILTKQIYTKHWRQTYHECFSDVSTTVIYIYNHVFVCSCFCSLSHFEDKWARIFAFLFGVITFFLVINNN